MTRVLSGAVLIVIAVAVVWLAPTWLFFAVAIGVAVLAVSELVPLARSSGLDVSSPVAGFTTAVVVASSAAPGAAEVAVMTVLVAVGVLSLGTWRGGSDALATVSASLFPALYIGLPISAMVGIRLLGGPRALFLLMLTVIVSDTAQYYSGRLFGARPLAPAISPKKTIEGAAGGFIFGTVLFVVLGHWWLPLLPLPFRVPLGLTLVALGIAGDLFESMLKRSAGVKDSSSIIPGHGGILDRIDALLFTAPVYYIVLKYSGSQLSAVSVQLLR
jgi:phosphatidate cytidylyltransferase